MQSSNRPIQQKRPVERYAGSSIVHDSAAHDTISMQAEASLYLINATMPTQNLATTIRKFQKECKPSWGTSGGAANRLFEQLSTRLSGMQPLQNQSI